jgi:glycosyltransferase involved in cell wall biosynthesis
MNAKGGVPKLDRWEVAMTSGLSLVLVGPRSDRPCGILDYVQHLAPELARLAPLTVCDYEESLKIAAIASPKMAFLVHFERSRVPGHNFLRRLAALVGDRLFVVPHEVYQNDPFAFPMNQLMGSWPVLVMKRLLYRWRHQSWFRELDLQAHGYYAKAVFPLTESAAAILQERAAPSAFYVVPLARLPATREMASEKIWPQLRFVWGLIGFLTPNNDYETLLQSLLQLPDQGLVLLGGERDPNFPQTQKWKARIQALGLESRVYWTGYIAESEWPRFLGAVDGFVAPFKHRSASASLFLAMQTTKPILASDISLTQEMVSLGAPLHLVASHEWVEAMSRASSPGWASPPDTYSWTYARVAQAYWQTMIACLGKQDPDLI